MSTTSQTSLHSPYKDKCCLIRHDSVFKAMWDWLILAFVIYTAIEIPFDVTFVIPRQTEVKTSRFGALAALSPIAIGNLIVDLLFIIDIPINFRSAVVNKVTEEVIANPKKIAILYLKSWFMVDFVAAIPFEFLVDPRHEGATTLMGLLKTARLLRLVRVTRKIDRYSEYGLAVILLLTCLFTLTAHWLACVWHAIGIAEARDNSGWLSSLAGEIDKPINQSNPTSGPSLSTRYITSLYFTLSSLTSVGFGNIAPSTNDEKVFAVLVMIVGALMYASIFGNLTVIIQRLYLQNSKQHEDLRLIREFVQFYKIPRELKENLENHILNQSVFTKGCDLQAVLDMFPSTIQTDICLHIHDGLFRENSTFRAAVPSCKRSLATKLKVQHYLPRQYIIKQGDEVDKVFFILKGIIHVVVDGQTILALGRGDTIYCEYKSVNSKVRAVASLLVQAATHIHYIEWDDFSSILKDYPVFREDFLAKMVFSYQIGDVEKENDEFEKLEGSPWGLETNVEMNQMTDVEPAESAEEDKDTSNVLASKLTDVEENMKIIDNRLLNMERKISLVIPLLRKALKDEV